MILVVVVALVTDVDVSVLTDCHAEPFVVCALRVDRFFGVGCVLVHGCWVSLDSHGPGVPAPGHSESPEGTVPAYLVLRGTPS